MRGLRRDRGPLPNRNAAHRCRHPRGRGAQRSPRRHRRSRAGEVGVDSRACRATASRSSTPMIDRVRAMEIATAAPCILFGDSIDADVRVRDVVLDELARPSFAVDTPWGSVDVRLKISGRHMAVNAAAALACVGAVGGDIEAGAAALSGVGSHLDADAGRAGAVGRDHPQRFLQRQPDLDARRHRRVGRPSGEATRCCSRVDGRDQRCHGRASRRSPSTPPTVESN